MKASLSTGHRDATIINVIPERSLFDSVIDISLENLPAHAYVVLSASLKDEKGNPWFYSEAVFEANEHGIVNLATDPSISGFYTGVDSMGLFWSMRPVDTSQAHDAQRGNEEEVYLTASVNHKIVANKKIHRYIASPGIESVEINDHGFIGFMCYPTNAHNLPGIITFSGSGGGLSRDMARLLAAHGYTVLALAYFGMTGLPSSLDNIHLEYFQNAIHWFKDQPQVNDQKIALRGASYGGELVLLLAATFPDDIHAVVVISPRVKFLADFLIQISQCGFIKMSRSRHLLVVLLVITQALLKLKISSTPQSKTLSLSTKEHTMIRMKLRHCLWLVWKNIAILVRQQQFQ